MNTNGSRKILEVLTVYEQAVLEEWIQEQLATASIRAHPIEESELRQQCGEFLAGLREAAQGENITDITAPEWAEVREMLTELSRTRRQQGFTPSETAMFVFSLRQPLLARLQEAYAAAGDLQAMLHGVGICALRPDCLVRT
jgi:rsbT co-antagonist protein RsbR